MERFDAVIIGGGPAGASAAIELARQGLNIAIVEKRSFPREVPCGEFLSHEVSAALRYFGVHDEFLSLNPVRISTFAFTPENGVQATHPLRFEAWAIKRSLLDQLLLTKAKRCGATVLQPVEVKSIEHNGTGFEVCLKSADGSPVLSAGSVIAAYGKRNSLDKGMKRGFDVGRSGMIGMKYHVPRELFKEPPDGTIQLYAAKDIYCGVNRVSDSEATVCFLSRGDRHPMTMLEILLERNRAFRDLFRTDLLSEVRGLRHYGTGRVFFGRRRVVEDGIFMTGDAAGVIGALAGDGIGMAMEGGLLIARILVEEKQKGLQRKDTERRYRTEWSRHFRQRVATADRIQRLVMNSLGGNAGARLLRAFPWMAAWIVASTRNNAARPFAHS